MKYAEIPESLEVTAQIRYNHPGSLATLHNKEADTLRVEFLSNEKGVAR